MQSYDFIVVGAGTAGCVLANRLTEDPDNRVLMLEAGGPNRYRLMAIPFAFMALSQEPSVNWGYWSEPEPHADNRTVPLPRGKVLGGSSSINGMMYTRGSPRDYDEWLQLGARGWSYADVLPYFKRAESSWRGASTYHGDSGPMPVSRHDIDNFLFRQIAATARARGYAVLDDFEGGKPEGVSAPDFTIHKGRRASTATRYLEPVLSRPNLSLRLGVLATRIVFEKRRAVGVEFARDGKLEQVRATREVILAGGAYNSPQLLLLSGIGPADELMALGVAPIHDLPGVGRNLQEHPAVGMQYEASGPITFESHIRFDRIALSYLRWRLFGTGLTAGLPLIAMALWKTRPELERADIEALFPPAAMNARVWFPGIRKGRGHIFGYLTILLHPESRGRVTLRSADPREPPRIVLNLLAEAGDRATFLRGLRMMREFIATAPASTLVRREIMPGTDVRSDAELLAYMRQMVSIVHHPTSTCAMGDGHDAVVDAELKVRGVESLRVVDASIMPRVVGGHTHAPTIMIAEKASDMILGKPALPREASHPVTTK